MARLMLSAGMLLRLGVGDDRPQARVHVGVAAAGARRDGQFLDDAREDLAALGVSGALLVLDRVPTLNGRTCWKLPLKSTRSDGKSYH